MRLNPPLPSFLFVCECCLLCGRAAFGVGARLVRRPAGQRGRRRHASASLRGSDGFLGRAAARQGDAGVWLCACAVCRCVCVCVCARARVCVCVCARVRTCAWLPRQLVRLARKIFVRMDAYVPVCSFQATFSRESHLGNAASLEVKKLPKGTLPVDYGTVEWSEIPAYVCWWCVACVRACVRPTIDGCVDLPGQRGRLLTNCNCIDGRTDG